MTASCWSAKDALQPVTRVPPILRQILYVSSVPHWSSKKDDSRSRVAIVTMARLPVFSVFLPVWRDPQPARSSDRGGSFTGAIDSSIVCIAGSSRQSSEVPSYPDSHLKRMDGMEKICKGRHPPGLPDGIAQLGDRLYVIGGTDGAGQY